MTSQEIEKQIIELVATERIYRPISSIEGKLKRMRPKLAKAIELTEHKQKFKGDRAYAKVQIIDNTKKARTLKEAVNEFANKYPKQGEILQKIIDRTRKVKESNLYFGVYEGCRLTADDYLGVMTNMGFTEATASRLYPELMNISHKMARKKQDSERSILIG
tara:strand:+ start:976 stop:1461 length:486 start_codon:yes stop_codon:yes gene_type:complete